MRSRNQESRRRYNSRAQSHRKRGNWGARDTNYGGSRSFGSGSRYRNDREDYLYDEPYGDNYGYNDSYQRNTDDYNRGYRHSGNYNRNSENVFDRSGNRMRNKWNDWTDNDERNYSSRYGARHYYGNGNGRDDGGNIFNQAGKRIKETWDDWTDRDDYDSRRYNDRDDAASYYGRDYGYGGKNYYNNTGQTRKRYNGSNYRLNGYADNREVNNYYREKNARRRNDRNVFERAADKIKEKWNDWTDSNDHDNEFKYRSHGRNRAVKSQGYANRDYRRNWRNRNKQHANW